jgi:hypothetical protein
MLVGCMLNLHAPSPESSTRGIGSINALAVLAGLSTHFAEEQIIAVLRVHGQTIFVSTKH